MSNILRDFKRTIYFLRKKYAFDLQLYRTTETINYETGAKTTTRTKYNILKGILLPSVVFRDYNYASLLQGVMPSQYGGIVDTTTRRIIIDAESLPDNFNLTVNDYFVFNHGRYAIKEISFMEVVNYYSVVVKQLIGQPPFESYNLYINDYLEMTETLNSNDLEIDPVIINTIVEPTESIYPYNPFLEYEGDT